MTDATELRVPKMGVTVEISLMGAQQRRAELYLSLDGGSGDRMQNLTAMLTEAGDFVPVATERRTSLYRKDAIVWVAVDLSDGDPPIEDAGRVPGTELFDERRRVDIALIDQTFLQGDLLFSAPPERRRVIDHLNDVASFFRLWTATRFYLINKQHVLTVTEAATESE